MRTQRARLMLQRLRDCDGALAFVLLSLVIQTPKSRWLSCLIQRAAAHRWPPLNHAHVVNGTDCPFPQKVVRRENRILRSGDRIVGTGRSSTMPRVHGRGSEGRHVLQQLREGGVESTATEINIAHQQRSDGETTDYVARSWKSHAWYLRGDELQKKKVGGLSFLRLSCNCVNWTLPLPIMKWPCG